MYVTIETRQGFTACSRCAAPAWPRVSHTSTSESISKDKLPVFL